MAAKKAQKQAHDPAARQVGGTHYVSRAIQPWDFIAANGLGFFEGNVVKYITRWHVKRNVEDLIKLKHYVEKLLEIEGEQ